MNLTPIKFITKTLNLGLGSTRWCRVPGDGRRKALVAVLLLCAMALTLSYGQTAGAATPRVLGISHVAIKATDMGQSLAFYRDFLGFAEQGRLNDNSDGAPRLVVLKVSEEQTIEICDASKLPPETSRLCQIGLQVEDAEAMRAHLAGKGYAGKLPAAVSHGQVKQASFTVKDPHGGTLEFVQFLPEGRTKGEQGRFLPGTRISDHITHVGITVDDFPASAHFYRDLLGFNETWRGSADGQEVAWVHERMQASRDVVELMVSPKGDRHFCLEVPDIDKAREKLEQTAYFKTYAARGKPIKVSTGRCRKRLLNLWDPEGVRVELMEPNTIDGQPAASSDAPLPKMGAKE